MNRPEVVVIVYLRPIVVSRPIDGAQRVRISTNERTGRPGPAGQPLGSSSRRPRGAWRFRSAGAQFFVSALGNDTPDVADPRRTYIGGIGMRRFVRKRDALSCEWAQPLIGGGEMPPQNSRVINRRRYRRKVK
jgi:hypothetical protein